MLNVSVYLITDDLSDISNEVNLPVNDQFRRWLASLFVSDVPMHSDVMRMDCSMCPISV